PADSQVSADVYLDGAAPAQIIARGQDLATATPTYYAVSITSGMQLQLQRVVAGQTAVLATLHSNDAVGGQWVQITLSLVVGDLPPGWSQWTNSGDPGFGVTDQNSLTTPHGLMTSGGSDLEARAWLSQDLPTDVQVGASLYLDSLVPAQIVVRGQGLDGNSP